MSKAVYAIMACALIALCASGNCRAEETWPGVDEAVVEKCASECGRPASPCILDLEGDALLFAFLVAGAAGGFAMGYYYRVFAGAGRKGDGGGDDAGEGGH